MTNNVVQLRSKEKTIADILKDIVDAYPKATEMVMFIVNEDGDVVPYYTATNSAHLAFMGLLCGELALSDTSLDD